MVEEGFFQMGRIMIRVFLFFWHCAGKINCLKTLIHSPVRSCAKVTKLFGHFEKSFGAEDVPHNNKAIRSAVWLFITGVEEFSEEYSTKAHIVLSVLLLWLELIRMSI